VKNTTHIANNLSASTVDRKTSEDKKKGNNVFATASTSSATRVKCSKKEDDNTHFRPRTTERKEKTPLSRKCQNDQFTYRQYSSMIQQIPEIAYRCEKSVLKCEKTLITMNKLLRTSRIENFWLRQNLQEMGPRFSQSEYNATFMPTGVRTPPSKATAAASTPRPRAYTPKSGNVESTTLSTETSRSRSSPPACARTPGLTSCQANRDYDKLERRPPRIIRSHTVRETTPITRTFAFTVPMSTPIRSSFQSSTNSSFQNYASRLPALRIGQNRQLEKSETINNVADLINRKEIGAAIEATCRQGEHGRGRLHPNASSAYSVVKLVSKEEIIDVTLSPSITVALMVHRRQRPT